MAKVFFLFATVRLLHKRMAMYFEKHFTLEEANALLPGVRAVFRAVHALMEELEDPAAQALIAEFITSDNGHGKNAQLTAEKRVDQANGLLKKLAEKGIVIQDWRRGLIDFPHIRAGSEVLLCYELSDGEEIGYFHDVDAGFAGRQPL